MAFSKQVAELLERVPVDGRGTPTDLYLLYDWRDRLLYVGISLSVAQRMGQHRNGKLWWPDVKRIKIQHYGSREAALYMEMVLIQGLQPPHNTVGKQIDYTRPRTLPQEAVC